MPYFGAENQELLKTVFFMYPSPEDARSGSRAGATGFITMVSSQRWGKYGHGVLYAVANHHSILAGLCTLRLIRSDGAIDLIETEPADWLHDPGAHDVSVLKLDVEEHFLSNYRHRVFDIHSFSEDIKGSPIDVGDDIFMIGRFVDPSGVEFTSPALKFGHISVMSAPRSNGSAYRGSYIVADMQSRSGFSGSPVFAFRTTGGTFGALRRGFIRLIGIHFAQFSEEWKIVPGSDAESVRAIAVGSESARTSTPTGHYIMGLSGMTCIEPASAILSLIDSPRQQAARKADDEMTYERFEKEGYPKLPTPNP